MGDEKMKITCPKCRSQYNLDASKIGEAGIKVRCPSCQHVFAVRKKTADTGAPSPAAKAEPKSTPSAPAPPKPPVPAPPGVSGFDEGGAIALSDDASEVSVPEEEPDIPEPPGLDEFDAPAAPSSSKSFTAPPSAATRSESPFADTGASAGVRAASSTPAAPKAPAPEAATAAGGGVEAGAFTGEGQWRVKKSGLGLIYGPADFATIEAWLRAERVGPKDEYSLNGGPWKPASQFEVLAKKLRIPYQGPPREEGAAAAAPAAAPSAPEPALKSPAETKAAAAPGPQPAPAVRPQAEPAPRPAAAKAEPARPAAPRNTSIEFEIPDGVPAPGDAKSGGSKGLVVTILVLLVLVALGAGFYFGVLRNARNAGRFLALLPPDARRAIEPYTVATPATVTPAADGQVTGAPSTIRQLAAKLPVDLQADYESAVQAFYADTPAGYTEAVATFEVFADTAGDFSVDLSSFATLAQAMGRYRGKLSGPIDPVLIQAREFREAAPRNQLAGQAFAVALLANGNREEAGALADELLKASPNEPVALYVRGLATGGARLEDLQRALKLRPGFAAAALDLASLKMQAGDPQAAAAALRTLLAERPDHAAALEMLGRQVEPKQGTLGEAGKIAQTGTTSAIEEEEIAETETAAGTPAQPAATSVNPVPTAARPEIDPFELFERAKKTYAAREFDKAERMFSQLLDDYYNEIGLRQIALTHYYLGEIHLRKDRLEQAHEQFSLALEVEPRFKQARERLKSVEARLPPPEGKGREEPEPTTGNRGGADASSASAPIGRDASVSRPAAATQPAAVVPPPATGNP